MQQGGALYVGEICQVSLWLDCRCLHCSIIGTTYYDTGKTLKRERCRCPWHFDIWRTSYHMNRLVWLLHPYGSLNSMLNLLAHRSTVLHRKDTAEFYAKSVYFWWAAWIIVQANDRNGYQMRSLREGVALHASLSICAVNFLLQWLQQTYRESWSAFVCLGENEALRWILAKKKGGGIVSVGFAWFFRFLSCSVSPCRLKIFPSFKKAGTQLNHIMKHFTFWYNVWNNNGSKYIEIWNKSEYI